MQNIPSLIWNALSGLPVIPSSKLAAEVWLSRGELWLVIFAVAIGLGLIGEYVAERKEKRWIPPHPGGWNWVRIATLVVIIGVIGELFCDADIWVSSDVLQTISDGEITALNAEIAPRRLKLEEQQAIARTVGQFANSAVRVASYALDLESGVLCEQIVAALSANNPPPYDACASENTLGSFAFGIHVTGDKPALSGALLGVFKDIFGASAVSSVPTPPTNGMSLGGQGAPADARIFIGVKPLAK